MKIVSNFLLFCVIISFAFVTIIPSSAQVSAKITYPKAMVFLKDGRIIKGEKLLMDEETIFLHINNNPQVFQINDVSQVMVKKGYANDFAQCFGGGCLALCGITLIANFENFDEYNGYSLENFIVGSLIWTAIFTAGGYLVGSVIDDWTPIYINRRASESNRTALASSKSDDSVKLPILFATF